MKLENKLKRIKELIGCHDTECQEMNCENCPILQLQKVNLNMKQVCSKCGQEIQ